jgi:hypothetical protein
LDTASISSLEKRSACIRLRVILAPTTSWWWKVTEPSSRNLRVFGLPTSCISAANRDTKSGAPPSRGSRSIDCSRTVSVCS